MLLKKLKLKNFLSYSYLDLEFPLGAVVFVGENGAGKSSILDAILFALYRENNRGRGLQGLIKRGERSSTVELIFSSEGRNYKVVRELSFDGKRIQSDARLYEIEGDKEHIIAQKTDVDRLIVQKTGIDKNIFLTSIYVRQGEIAKLIEMRPAERKQIIGRLLGIDDLEKAYSNMRDLLVYFEENRREIEGSLKMKPMFQQEYNEICEKIRVLKEKIVNHEYLLSHKRDEIKILENEKKIWEEKKKNYQELSFKRKVLQREINNILRNIKELDESIERAKRAKNDLVLLKEKVERLERIEKAFEAYKQLDILNKEKENVLEKLKEYNEYVKRIKELQDKVDEYKRLVEQQRSLQNDISAEGHLRGYLTDLNKDYQNRIDEYEALKNYLDSIVSLLSSFSIKLTDNLSVIRETYRLEVEKTERILEEIEIEIEELNRNKLTLQGAMGEKKEILEKLRNIKGLCPVCGHKLTEEHRASLLKKYKLEIEKLETEIKKLEERLSEKVSVYEEYSRRRETLLKIDIEDIIKKVVQFNNLKENIKSKEKILSDIKKQIEDINEKKIVLKKLEERIKELEKFYNEYIALTTAVSRTNLEKINDRLVSINNELEKIYGKLKALGNPELPNETELESLRNARVNYYKALTIAGELEKLIEKRKSLMNELEKYKEQEEEIVRQLESLDFTEKEYEEVIERYQRCRNELAKMEEFLKNMRQVIHEYGDRRRKLLETLKKLETEEKKLKDLIEYISLLKKIRELFGKDGLQLELRKKAIPLIQKYVREFAELFEFDFYGIKITDDYEVYIIDSEGERSIDGASGGEKVAIALALRLAIARVFQGSRLSMLMLDEPTQYLDEYRRRYLVNILKKLFSDEDNIFPQLILVTHDRELEDAADMLYKVEKIGTSSRVVKISS
ncbi:MAG: AAA family ATPase [Thermoproteales archaeon]|nr:AAA family ATPase [Thermoproteales archaeon]